MSGMLGLLYGYVHAIYKVMNQSRIDQSICSMGSSEAVCYIQNRSNIVVVYKKQHNITLILCRPSNHFDNVIVYIGELTHFFFPTLT